MNTYCPLIKEECKGNECVMWKDEKCSIVMFMKFMEIVAQRVEKETEEEISNEIKLSTSEETVEEIPNGIKLSTPEELAAELISFAKKEFPEEDESGSIYIITDFFWRSKNIEKRYLPADIQLKIYKAERLAQKQLNSEREVRGVKEKEQLEKEKPDLSSLVDPCVGWANEQGLKKVTEADVDAFLVEKNIDVSPRTKRRALCAMVNSKLKKEKTELSSLVNPCVDWVKEHGLKKVTEADVDTFLLEKNKDVSPRTKKRELCAMVKKATACD
ncbi:Uncharacterised protein [uncultured archaeon]|nr:Uncharacterised protein [uncultured archaeon]